jgi:hypothetical protein
MPGQGPAQASSSGAGSHAPGSGLRAPRSPRQQDPHAHGAVLVCAARHARGNRRPPDLAVGLRHRGQGGGGGRGKRRRQPSAAVERGRRGTAGNNSFQDWQEGQRRWPASDVACKAPHRTAPACAARPGRPGGGRPSLSTPCRPPRLRARRAEQESGLARGSALARAASRRQGRCSPAARHAPQRPPELSTSSGRSGQQHSLPAALPAGRPPGLSTFMYRSRHCTSVRPGTSRATRDHLRP